MHRARLLTKYWPIPVVAAALCFIFYKTLFYGLVPFPSDLLVSWFFPYKNGGWVGFDPWTTHKEFIAADVVRQLYPWRVLAMDVIKQGFLPLWNPYSFSGTPLLANVQTAAFYPLNILFFLFESRLAWVIYIFAQPIMAVVFMYMFIRSMKLSQYAGVFAGIAFAGIGYTTIWFELGVVGHAAVWLPLLLWSIRKYVQQHQFGYLLVGSFAIAASVLAGHAQTAVYVVLVAAAYFVYSVLPRFRIRKIMHGVAFIVLGFGIAAVQIVPSLEFMGLSARDVSTSSEVFHRFQMPFYHLVTMVAPDFFGNPATLNFWGSDYGEFMAYSGVVALICATIALRVTEYRRHVLFFMSISGIALLFALPTPLSDMLEYLRIPVLGTGIPSRSLFIVQFSIVILSAIGIDRILSGKKISYIIPAVFIIVLLGLWSAVLLGPSVVPDIISLGHASVALRNLILPSVTIVTVISLIIFLRFVPSARKLVFFVLLFVAACEYSYFMNKFLPFAKMSFIFPEHQLIQKLQSIDENYRVYGYDTARLETNLPVAWGIQSPEGYDPLYIRRYGELVHAVSMGGHLDTTIPRSDAALPVSLPNQDTPAKQRFMNMAGVRYVLDKDDSAPTELRPDPGKFDPERFELIWQEYKWKIYENKKALPRAAIYYDVRSAESDSGTIRHLFSDNFDPSTQLVVEGKRVKTKSDTQDIGSVTVRAYTPHEVVMSVDSKQPGFLFLSDAWYPGWNAYIDGALHTVYRANYAFRAVEIPSGQHTVEMKYEPMSFRVGLAVSLVSLMIIMAYIARSRLV